MEWGELVGDAGAGGAGMRQGAELSCAKPQPPTTSTFLKFTGELFTLPKLYKVIIAVDILGGGIYPSGGISSSTNGTGGNSGISSHDNSSKSHSGCAVGTEPSSSLSASPSPLQLTCI